MNLAELLLGPVSKTLKLKCDLPSPVGLLRTVVAFASTSDGTVPTDVEDGTRTVRGVAEPLTLERRGQRRTRVVKLGEASEIGSGPTDPQRGYFRADG